MRLPILALAVALGLHAEVSFASMSQPRGFSFTGLSNRVLTPNGDALNDNIKFNFSNPRDSAGMIRLYNVRGVQIATLAINSGDQSEIWDGRSGGASVPTGVYVYVIEIEGSRYSGTVVVVR